MYQLFAEFYKTFWSLQLPFSKPSVFTEPKTFEAFKESINRVIPVIKEATAKERALMGSKANSGSGSLKRRREPEISIDPVNHGYFFAKYLTSPELLDLEVCAVELNGPCLYANYTIDCRYPLPPPVPVSATHPPPPSAHIYEDREGNMVNSPEPFTANGFHPWRRCREVGS